MNGSDDPGVFPKRALASHFHVAIHRDAHVRAADCGPVCVKLARSIDDHEAIRPRRDAVGVKDEPLLVLPVAHEHAHRRAIAPRPDRARAGLANRTGRFADAHRRLDDHFGVRFRFPLHAVATGCFLRVVAEPQRALRELRIRFADGGPARIGQCAAVVVDEPFDAIVGAGVAEQASSSGASAGRVLIELR